MFTFAKATSEMDSLAANVGAANAVVAAATDLDNCSAFWRQLVVVAHLRHHPVFFVVIKKKVVFGRLIIIESPRRKKKRYPKQSLLVF